MQQRERSVPERTARRKQRAARERPFRIFLPNGDFTPMGFVVHILVALFPLPVFNAEQLMFSAHLNGGAHVRTLPVVEAQHRIARACFAAKLRQLPLRFSREAEWDRLTACATALRSSRSGWCVSDTKPHWSYIGW